MLIAAGAMLAQQGRGTIQGVVSDSSGAAVQGAVVRVANADTNVTASTESNAEGIFSVPNLNVGRYAVTVEKTGFRKAVLSGLTLQVDQRLQADIKLDLGQVAETIEVKAENTLVDTSGASV